MSKTLPIKHLSARVPWHDNKWNGTFCSNVLDNSFCRILPRIDATKNPDTEPNNILVNEDNFPPCIAEKGTFLSKSEYTRELPHAWAEINKLYKDYLPAKYHHKPYSFNAVPFLWMMKGNAKDNHISEKANTYELEYDPKLEQEIDEQLGFEGNKWVQHQDNQKALLDSFFGCLKKRESLIFFYCKHTPLSEPNQRIIVGVAKVRNDIGTILNYEFPVGYNGYRSYPWDRCVEHTLTDKNPDGFLLPYHELIEYSQKNEIDLREYAAMASNFEQFSYASELVEHDTAIDSLLSMAEVLKKSEVILNKSYKKELQWIDDEISRIWNMRGAFPGMGSVLSALKINEGNTIAWEIEKYILAKDNDLLKTDPWTIFEESIANPKKHIKDRGEKLFNQTTQRIWKYIPSNKKQLYKILSRIQLNNEQAETVFENYQDWIGSIDEIIRNPYLLYDKTRFYFKELLTYKQIDKAILPPPKIREAFPLPPESAMSDQLDERRVRSCCIWVLEEAADDGHSLLPINDVLQRMEYKVLDESFPINEDILLAQSESILFNQEINLIRNDKYHFFKLKRLIDLKNIITQKINKESVMKKVYGIDKDWLKIINEWPDMPKIDINNPDNSDELLARKEKAEALRILCNYRFSVLIGPAGSGKTTLLKIFEDIPEIKMGGVAKLAPTGKARVKLGHNAKTIAQFLYPDRYDGYYNIYYNNEDAEKSSSARNIIIDEASMLTEEQLAAVFDALGPVDRIILVGDYRQLPPIGTGRPFVDIVNLLKPSSFSDSNIKAGPAYAELCQIRRQLNTKDEKRLDVMLSRCFGDEPTQEDLDLFHEIAAGTIECKNLRVAKWYNSKDFKVLFEKIIKEELDLKDDVIKAFNRTLGAKDIGGYQYFNYDDAEKKIENWQIISPVNGFGYGVKEVNKFIQTTFRKSFIDLALNVKRHTRQIAKPKGTDNIVYGDKVINLKNTQWRDHQWIKPKEKKAEALNYFANGEIGVITGEFRGRSGGSGEPKIEISFSTQPGYSYVFWPNELGEDGKYPFELAYAITVHKAQGSGFKKVFFVLPSGGSILSRELLYTALTRQEDKIIILHQGDFRDFIKLAGTEASATARRFTDLFFFPEVKQIEKKYYDARYINVSERGERMISKNEVIIANCLNKYKKQISYAYENKLKLENSGRTIKPDFTIEHLGNGRRFYWEHLGMMTRDDYREKWEKKKKGYLNDGFVLFSEAKSDTDKVLIITEENPNGGVDSQYFDQIVRKYILEASV